MPTAKDHRFFYAVQIAAVGMRRQANQGLEPTGLTSSHLALLFLLRSGIRRPGELASALHINPSAVTALTRRLQDRGMVVKERDPDDGRAFVLRATDASEAAVNAALPLLDALNDGIDAAFSPDELDVVARFLRHVAGLETP